MVGKRGGDGMRKMSAKDIVFEKREGLHMEIEKLSQIINKDKLFDELSDLMILKQREDEFIDKHKRLYILNESVKGVKSKNRVSLEEVLTNTNHRIRILGLEIYCYEKMAEKYSRIWIPERFYKEKAKDYGNDPMIQRQINYTINQLTIELHRIEVAIMDAKRTVEKYKCQKPKRGEKNGET